MLTSIFAFNKASYSSTLAVNLLAIVARLLDCNCNISNLVIGLSIDVLVDVARGINDSPNVSFDVGLGALIEIGQNVATIFVTTCNY
jgi:hypothetical protein